MTRKSNPVHPQDQQNKLDRLRSLLAGFRRVGVAFSGGVDSSFLLKISLDVLEPDKVMVLHARSCLQKQNEQVQAASWPERHGYDPAALQWRNIALNPLARQEFTANPPNRCYLCKRHLYICFLNILQQEDISILLDGTNSDDLRQGETGRPGLRALAELGVRIPLVDCSLSKREIRELSRELSLDTWAQPSSSCLATRIPHGLEITAERLAMVEKLEQIVTEAGFPGCRARLLNGSEHAVRVQVPERDLCRLHNGAAGRTVVALLKSRGISKIYLDADGR
ncbi:MAG: hypothetical protein ACL93V_14580 [Candidatus Electrothrix sp. YB6]